MQLEVEQKVQRQNQRRSVREQQIVNTVECIDHWILDMICNQSKGKNGWILHAPQYGRKGGLIKFSKKIGGTRKQKKWEELVDHLKLLITQRQLELK